MAYPDDILLPVNAKQFGFIDSLHPYNINWDLNWSFQFALTGTEHGFCTFLTKTPKISANPGQYLGYLQKDFYILTEDLFILKTETDELITYDSNTVGYLSIAFDSTGKYALSSGGNSGVDQSKLKVNSLIIRNEVNDIILYESLSTLSTEFFLTSAVVNFQTLRFRLSNAGKKLSIEYRPNNTSNYKTLTSIPISIDVSDNSIGYPGFSFCSPISSLTPPSTLFLKNFHVQGNPLPPTYNISPLVPLQNNILNLYTSISGVSATPIK